MEWDYIKNNPTRKIKSLKLPDRPPTFLSRNQIRLLLSEASPWLRPFIVLGLNTGMRKQEILNLRWKHIDLSKRRIVVQCDDGFQTKNYRYRAIPINNALYDELLFLKKYVPKPRSKEYFRRTTTQQNYVFCNDKGEKIGDIKRAFHTLCKKLKLKGVTPHVLRHTYASQLLMSESDLPTVQKLLGHRDIQTTQIYSHLSDAHLQEHANKVNFEAPKVDIDKIKHRAKTQEENRKKNGK